MNNNGKHDIESRNLALIQEIYPQYSVMLTSQAEGAYDIADTASNTFSCRMNETGQWLHGPDDPWAKAEKDIKEADWTKQSMFLVVRPGLGYLPFSLYPNLRKGRNAQRMLIVEDRIDLFLESIKRFDWTDILRSDRVILMLVENPILAVIDFFVGNPVAMLPPFTGMCGVEVGQQEKLIMDRLSQTIADMAKNVNQASAGYLNDLSAHYASTQNDPTYQKRLLMVEPEHDYLADGIREGFEQENWFVNTYKANTRLLRFLNPFIWLVYTRENFPDMLLWMNRNTLSREGAHLLKQFPIKKVLWYLDNPKRVETTQEELESTDAYFSFDPTYLSYLKELSGAEGFYLPTAAGIAPLPECMPGMNWPDRNGPDVGFMGALAVARYQNVLAFWNRRDPAFVEILDGIVEEYLADPSVSLEDRFTASPGRERLPYSGFVVLYLEERVTYLKRLRQLLMIKDFGLVTYGSVEWARNEWAQDLAPCYSGEAPRYREDLPGVYYHTKINVNIFHAQCINSSNPRVYDVLAAGGFLLTEYKPVLEEEFELNRHLVCFHTPDELKEKVAYYLTHEAERDEIARAGQQFVLEHATYRHRVQEILQRISS
jgi:ribosomal protein S17E